MARIDKYDMERIKCEAEEAIWLADAVMTMHLLNCRQQFADLREWGAQVVPLKERKERA